MLIKKAVAVRKHLSGNRKDRDSKLYVYRHRKMTLNANLVQPPHSHRVPYPPSLPLLQDRWCPSPYLEVRERHCIHYGLIEESGVWYEVVDDGQILGWSYMDAWMLYGSHSLFMVNTV
jgi:hypothetical protein